VLYYVWQIHTGWQFQHFLLQSCTILTFTKLNKNFSSSWQEVGKPSLNAAQPYAKAEGRVFLLVPTCPGFPGTKAAKRLLLLLCSAVVTRACSCLILFKLYSFPIKNRCELSILHYWWNLWSLAKTKECRPHEIWILGFHIWKNLPLELCDSNASRVICLTDNCCIQRPIALVNIFTNLLIVKLNRNRDKMFQTLHEQWLLWVVVLPWWCQ